MIRKTIYCIIAFALALHGFGLPASFSAEPTKTLSCIKLETLIEANEKDFAAFRKRNRIDEEGVNAGEAIQLGVAFLIFGVVGLSMSGWDAGTLEEFNRLQEKNRQLRDQAFRENCKVPPSTAPWKAVHEMFNPPYEPDQLEDNP